jgi:serine/threonine-protein kinase
MADAKSAPSVGELVAVNYQILGTAGAGGMGVVYRALDLKLQRTVALKFLPPDLNASERDKARFLKEARTASSLDHPNIGVIYGIEETPDERTFIAMAYYEGQSLAQRIRGGPLAPAEATEIAIQVLKGLEYAHLQGIEHRDVKPSNIMLTRQGPSGLVVKLVDFGLAHVSQQTASQTHSLSGTIAYMSPEQTLGRQIDCRSDIWASGVVLLEMLAGRNPFGRETIPATIFAILNEAPHVADAVPAELRQIVYRALAKDPVRRYQSCSEMLANLEAIRTSLPAASAADPQASSQRDSKSDLRSALKLDSKSSARVKELLRRSRENASASAWGMPPPKPTWKPWIFGLGAPLLVVAALLLIPPVRARIAGLFAPLAQQGGASGKSAAYEGYVAALGYMQRYDKPGNLDRAISELQAALKADPLFALAYSELGEAYRMKYQTERDPKWLDMALANCQKAEQLDDRLPSAYSTLGTIHNQQGKPDLALQEFHEALDINPRDPGAVRGIARLDETAGKLDDAEKGFRKVIAILPDDWRGYNDLGNYYADQGKYAQAIAQYRQALDLAPDNAQVYSNLGSAYLDAGDEKLLPRAEQSLQKSLALAPTYEVLANLAALYSEEKKYAESADFSNRALQLNGEGYVVWDTLRLDYVSLGDSAKADAAMQSEQQVLERTVKLNTQNAMPEAMLANLYAHQGLRDKAEARIQSALSSAPNDPQVLMEVADAAANLHDRAAAIGYIQNALNKGADIEGVKTDVELKPLNLDFGKELRKK